MIAYSHIIKVGTGKIGERAIRKILSGSCQRLYVEYTHAGGVKEGYSRA